MSFDPIVNGALAFLAVLILMALNIPIGISMLIVGFTGFGFIVGFEQAFFILGTAPYEAVSKYSLSVLPFFVLMGNLARLPIKTKKGKTDKLYFDTASYGAVPKIKKACSKPTMKPNPVKPTISIEIPIGILSAIKINTAKKAKAPFTIGSKLIFYFFPSKIE